MHKKIVMLFVGITLGFLVGCATIGHGLVGAPQGILLTEKEALLAIPALREGHEEILDEYENRTGIWAREIKEGKKFNTFLILCNGNASPEDFRIKEKFIEDTFGVKIVSRIDFEDSQYATTGFENNIKMRLLKSMAGFKGKVLRTTKAGQNEPVQVLSEKPAKKLKGRKFRNK